MMKRDQLSVSGRSIIWARLSSRVASASLAAPADSCPAAIARAAASP
jgi:hypothetical protein